MFHKHIVAALERLSNRITDNYTSQREDYWELRHDLDRLVKALNMTKDNRHVNEYIKKGGPEHG